MYKTPTETTFFTKKKFHLAIRGCTEAKKATSLTEINNNFLTESVNYSTPLIAVIDVYLLEKTEIRKVRNSFSLLLSTSG
uniref:Uncharacterized protein n=1 Tax=Strongyloides venezuelensis TaxID=75913 RepID=A0A0K0FI61_STRVS